MLTWKLGLNLLGTESTLVTLDIDNAYDSVKPAILFSRLRSVNVPYCIFAQIQDLFTEHTFYFSQNGLSSQQYKQTRRVPQGSVLSPILLNILLSSIPAYDKVQVYVYAGDVVFFSASNEIHSLYNILKSYLHAIEVCLVTCACPVMLRKLLFLHFHSVLLCESH